jgi:hypothetical protein
VEEEVVTTTTTRYIRKINQGGVEKINFLQPDVLQKHHRKKTPLISESAVRDDESGGGGIHPPWHLNDDLKIS